jgi:stage V sporulation protein G
MAKKKENAGWGCLSVTKVNVWPFKAAVGHIKAVASVVLNDQLAIRGLRVMEGDNGLFVGYPVDPFYKGEDLMHVCKPTTRELREHIEACVLEMYHASVG